VRTLSIEATSSESAGALCRALSAFDARLLEQPPGTFVVRVTLTRGSDEVVALLNAIREYVNARASGPALLELDGRSYLMDASV
jgi:hypothetical protein